MTSRATRSSFYTFVRTFWHTLESDPFADSWYIRYQCELAQRIVMRIVARQPCEYPYYLINVPPGSSKSTIWSRMLPAWCWVVDASMRLITTSYSEDVALENAEKSHILMQSPLFTRCFPELEVEGTKTRLRTSRNGVRYVSATKGQATGRHADLIIPDDPENTRTAQSDAERKAATDFVTKTLSTRKRNQLVTTTVIVQQRLHELDSTGVVLGLGVPVFHICLPAEASKLVSPPELAANYQGGLFDPIRFPPAVLQRHKAILGSYAYAGQFDQSPAPPEGGIFKREWFGSITKGEYDMLALPEQDIFIDPAYTDKSENDPTGITHFAYSNNMLYIRLHKDVWLDFPALVSFISGYAAGMTVRIEPKASGISLKQALKAGATNAVLTPPPTRDKSARAFGVTPFVEAGRVVLVEGAWNGAWLDSVCTFPNAAHDEAVDNLTAAIEFYNKRQTWAL